MSQPTKSQIRFKCFKPWADKETGLAIVKGSQLELIEVEDGEYVLEVVSGIEEGLQMPFTAIQLAEHFEII